MLNTEKSKMKVGQDTITLAIAGAEVTINAATLADLWLKQLAQEQGFFAHAPLPHITIPSLANGELWAGVLLNEDGTPSHHVILLPGEAARIGWNKAVEWAKEIGGELPTRREQSLLFANLKLQFKGEWYWSGEQHAATSDGAWLQVFDDGGQYDGDKSFEARARAVRRLPIQSFINSTGQS
jgi:hypothetical protein